MHFPVPSCERRKSLVELSVNSSRLSVGDNKPPHPEKSTTSPSSTAYRRPSSTVQKPGNRTGVSRRLSIDQFVPPHNSMSKQTRPSSKANVTAGKLGRIQSEPKVRKPAIQRQKAAAVEDFSNDNTHGGAMLTSHMSSTSSFSQRQQPNNASTFDRQFSNVATRDSRTLSSSGDGIPFSSTYKAARLLQPLKKGGGSNLFTLPRMNETRAVGGLEKKKKAPQQQQQQLLDGVGEYEEGYDPEDDTDPESKHRILRWLISVTDADAVTDQSIVEEKPSYMDKAIHIVYQGD